MKIGLMGVPFSRGQIKSGVEKAPEALRKAGLMGIIKQLGHDVKDYGDVCYKDAEVPAKAGIHENMEWLPQVALCSEKVSLKAEEIIMKDRKLLTLGGDHSVALGTVDGHIKAKLGNVCILWVDAHPDLNTADTSPSGNLHGMTAALLVKEMSNFWPYLPGLDWQKPTISLKKMAYIGLRSIDTDERVIIEKFGVAAYGMSDIEKMGIHEVTEEALWKIDPDHECSIHVSFDIDALDTLEAPATGTPVRGGLTLREALILIETVQKTNRLTAIDLVEINPLIGSNQQVKLTLEAAMHLVKAAFAHSRGGKIRHKVYPEASFKPLYGDLDSLKFEFSYRKNRSRIASALLDNKLHYADIKSKKIINLQDQQLEYRKNREENDVKGSASITATTSKPKKTKGIKGKTHNSKTPSAADMTSDVLKTKNEGEQEQSSVPPSKHDFNN